MKHAPFLCVLLCAASLCSAEAYKSDAGPYDVETRAETWRDSARNRDVPVKLYIPKNTDNAHPAVIFSHGLGGSRDGATYLGEHWASHGYVAVFLQHPGSDRELLRDKGPMQKWAALKRALRKPRNFTNRPKDVSFAIDQLERLNTENGALRGRLNTDRIAIAGHSFGAWTALTVAGRKLILPGGRALSFKEPRLDAAIVMSGQPGKNPDARDASFAGIDIPCLHMTGTLDTSPISDTTAEDRKLPFKHTPGPDHGGAAQYLLVLDGGDHQVFSGRRWRKSDADPDNDPRFHALIRQSTTAFLDTYLRDDQGAGAWLQRGGFEREVGADGTVRIKQ